MLKKSLRICKNGHRYYKSSSCNTCPICEKKYKPKADFLSLLAAPARRALEKKGIKTLQQLSKFSKEELLTLHGFGKASITKLTNILKKEGLFFAGKKLNP